MLKEVLMPKLGQTVEEGRQVVLHESMLGVLGEDHHSAFETHNARG